MHKWKKVVQCNNCKKIYDFEKTPQICKKCGTVIGKRDLFAYMLTGQERLTLIDAKIIIARRRLWKWEIKEEPEV